MPRPGPDDNLGWIYEVKTAAGTARVVEFMFSDNQRLVCIESDEGYRWVLSGDSPTVQAAWKDWVNNTYGVSWYGEEIVYKNLSDWRWR